MTAVFESQRTNYNPTAPPEALIRINTDNIRSIARSFFEIYLRRHGHVRIADIIVNEKSINPNVRNSMHSIQESLEQDQAQQFEDILSPLFRSNISQSQLRSEFNTTANTLFDDGANWGRVLTFLQFAAEFAIYCTTRAHFNQTITTLDVLDWTEGEILIRINQLEEINQQNLLTPGQDEWHLNLSAMALSAGVVVTLVTAGLFALKRLIN